MPKATYEQGTELLLDAEAVTLRNATWVDVAGSDVFRQGPLVTGVLRVKNVVAAAWEKKKYKTGERASEGGHVYEATAAPETDENKPSTKPSQWKDLGTVGAIICTLPKPYWPAATYTDSTVEVSTAGVVTALDAIVEGKEHVYEFHYRAASVSP